MQFTEEQKDEFCHYLREVRNRQQAAEALSEKYGDPRITATKFRHVAARDGAFFRMAREAELEGKGSLVERLERCAVEMAEGGHWPALKFLLTTYGEQFGWARSAKVQVDAKLEIEAVAGILSRYVPPEMYDELMSVVEQRMIEDAPQELPPAVSA